MRAERSVILVFEDLGPEHANDVNIFITNGSEAPLWLKQSVEKLVGLIKMKVLQKDFEAFEGLKEILN